MKTQRTHKTQQTLLTSFIYVVWALILTYPLVKHPLSHIPLGSEPVGTVPLFNLWTLQWNIDQLMQGYPNYWDAPIFAPNPGAFAFSEIQPLTALLAAPFWLISPALGYNFVVLLFLTLNGWFAFWLLKSWEVSFLPALLAGLLMQSLPFVAQEMGVLQLIAIFGLLWSLFFLSRFLQRPTWQNSVGLALGIPVTFFTCGYYGLLSVFVLPLAFLAQIKRRRINLKTAAHLAIVISLTLILSAPVLSAQRQRLNQYAFTRSDKIVENNSARLQYYANVLDYNLLYGHTLGRKSSEGQRLFPGVAILLLAGLGLFGKTDKRLKLYLTGIVILGLLLSLGLHLRMGSVQPYQWIKMYVPGFDQLRSPFRFAVLAQMHLVLLAGFGLANLTRWRPNYGALLGIGLAVLALLESVALPMPLQPIPPLQTDAGWQVWLNRQSEPPTVVMLPFAKSSGVADFEQTVLWMLESRYFKGNMANGYSGFFPKNHARLREQMLQFPTVGGIGLLRNMQVDYVVVHHNLANAPPARDIENVLPLVFEDPQAGVSIYAANPEH